MNGLAWELGLTATHFDGDSLYDYGEVFFGLNAQRWNLRAYLSPSYFGSGVRTLYLEANGGMALIGPLRAFAHMGALRPIGQVDAADSRRTRADARAGLAIGAAAAEVRLAWVHGSRAGLYPIAYGDHRNAWVASASWFF